MIGQQQITHAVDDLRRLRQVVEVLVDEGLSLVTDDLNLHYLYPLSARWRQLWRSDRNRRRQIKEGPPPQVRLRRALERLGPTYIKFGQILSTRPDVLPPAFVSELAKLQDRVRPVPTAAVKKEIERELGQPAARLFSRFSAKPIAAASLAQVHKAKLKGDDRRTVAVKVRRPDIVRTVRTDTRILLHLAQLMESHLTWSRRYRPVALAREFADWTRRELDFEQEAANIARFSAAFAKDEEIVIPEVIWPLTTQGVLTAELIEGVRVDDYEGLERAGIDRQRLARLGLKAGFRQFLINGFFHADPHPGNLVALPPLRENGRPRLGLYDFGMVGQLSEKVRYELVGCFLSFSQKDIEKYVSHIVDMADSTEGADLEGFAKEAAAMLTGVLWKPTEHKRLGQTFYEVILAAARHGVVFSRELVLVGKALLTLETIGLNLWPNIDLDREIEPFLKEVFRHEFDPRRLSRQAASGAFDSLYSAKHLPEDARAIIARLARGEIGVRLDLEELRDLKEEFDRQNDIRVMALVGAAALLASSLATGLGGLTGLLGRIGFILAIFLIGWTFWLVSQKPRL